MNLEEQITALAESPPQQEPENFSELFQSFLNELETGNIRAAEPSGDGWKVNGWVKQGILLGFRYGKNRELNPGGSLPFFDKHTYPVQKPDAEQKNIRIVPGGSSIRTGAYVGSNVTMMPPAYVNTGAYVGDGTMIDSHALVGSCAQVGDKVHLSASAQLGGVLEPIGAMPVIVEEQCMIGGNTGIYEGTRVGREAVIGAGVILTRSTPVYDLVNETIYKADADHPLHIPEGAVVIPGSRVISGNEFARMHNLAIQTPVIIKYRDDRTDDATTLENLLR